MAKNEEESKHTKHTAHIFSANKHTNIHQHISVSLKLVFQFHYCCCYCFFFFFVLCSSPEICLSFVIFLISTYHKNILWAIFFIFHFLQIYLVMLVCVCVYDAVSFNSCTPFDIYRVYDATTNEENKEIKTKRTAKK